MSTSLRTNLPTRSSTTPGREDVLLAFIDCLQRTTALRGPGFTGVGLAVVDDAIFDDSTRRGMRPDSVIESMHLTDDRTASYLASISSSGHTFHDGFVFFDKDGYLSRVAQYFVPAIQHDLPMNNGRGVRYHSAKFGSRQAGVIIAGVVCTDGDVFSFVHGRTLRPGEPAAT
jgi:DisA bacterial checkpoint controller nucleotide-binding